MVYLVAELIRNVLPSALLELSANCIRALLLVLIVLAVLIEADLLLDGVDGFVAVVLTT